MRTIPLTTRGYTTGRSGGDGGDVEAVQVTVEPEVVVEVVVEDTVVSVVVECD